MKKSVYFIIQIIWSLIVSTVIWYLGIFVVAYGTEFLNKTFNTSLHMRLTA